MILQVKVSAMTLARLELLSARLGMTVEEIAELTVEVSALHATIDIPEDRK